MVRHLGCSGAIVDFLHGLNEGTSKSVDLEITQKTTGANGKFTEQKLTIVSA